MARVINEQDNAARRREILDALGMSKGAFYHYFDSKAAVLEALIARMRDDAMGVLTPLLDDPALPALDKIRRFFAASGRWKTDRRDILLSPSSGPCTPMTTSSSARSSAPGPRP